MNQLSLSTVLSTVALTVGMRRLAFLLMGVMIAMGVLAPTSVQAASRADRGSAEWVYVHHGKHSGHHHSHCSQTYTVRKGDTLSKLASRFGTTVHALAHANGIHNPNRIYVGQKLCIPKHGHVPPAPQCKAYHTVKHHDTMVSIAKRYHTSVSKIISDNNLRGPHYIHTGQQLCIK